jgi:hypothetical protein
VQRRRHPQQNLESMEQNIRAFSKLERQRSSRIVRSSLRKHVKVSLRSCRKNCDTMCHSQHYIASDNICVCPVIITILSNFLPMS